MGYDGIDDCFYTAYLAALAFLSMEGSAHTHTLCGVMDDVGE
jgi:hypothetical protein